MKKIFTIIIMTAYLVQSNAQTALTLQPDGVTGKDALLHGLDTLVNTNFGNNTEFPATAWTFGGTPGVVRSLIQFDLASIPTNATVTSAQLSLYAIDSTSGQGQHSTFSGSNESYLEKVTSAWDESTVTWNTQPSSTTVGRVMLPASTSATEDYLNINVTGLVQDMVTTPSTNFGFIFKLQLEEYYRRMNFSSSDHTNPALRPRLEVTYSITNDINEASNNAKAKIYSSSQHDLVSIEADSKLIGSRYIIADQLGRKISEGKILSEITTLSISDLSSGIYILNLDSQAPFKIIKQ